MGEFVRLEVDGGIGTIRLDRPPMNALNTQIQRELGEAAAEFSANRDVAAVIVYGGEKVFAAGADVKEMATMSYTDMVDHSVALQSGLHGDLADSEADGRGDHGLRAGRRLRAGPVLRLPGLPATTRSSASPRSCSASFPGAGGTQRLPRLVGPARAKDLDLQRPVRRRRRGAAHRPVDQVVGRRRRLLRGARDGRALRRRAGVRAAGGEGGHRPRARGAARDRARDRAPALRGLVRDRGPRHGHAVLRRVRPGKAKFAGR
jgi:enoyl-CoA hydratase/carnithine racemase